MATEAYSNYASTLTKGGVAVGKCMVIDFPELSTDKLNTTNHASGGYAESIPSGLVALGDITLSVIVIDGVLATIRGEMLAKTISTVVIGDGVETMSFDGYYLSAKKEAADAQSPDVNKLTVVLAATGALVITP